MLRFISLAVDPVNAAVLFTGCGETLQDCQEHAERTDSPYNKTFNLYDGDLGAQLYKWLKSAGLSHSDAKGAVRSIGKSLADMFDEIMAEKSRSGQG